MIYLAGEPDDIWWNGEVQEVYLGADLVWKSGPTIETYDVEILNALGRNTFHPLINLSPPPGETWGVTIEGAVTETGLNLPTFQVGELVSGAFNLGPVLFSGEITSISNRVGLVTDTTITSRAVSFVGTVTVTIP